MLGAFDVLGVFNDGRALVAMRLNAIAMRHHHVFFIRHPEPGTYAESVWHPFAWACQNP